MISKLPRWVWSGAWALAFVAGMINAVGLLGFEHQAVTHLTGTTSFLGAALGTMDWRSSAHFTTIIASFVAGCVISGFIVRDSTLRLGHHYGIALSLETLLLCMAVPLLQRHSSAGVYLTSCACGLQNAMVTTYSGAVVRTTHLSGMFTDLGIFLGHAIRGVPVDVRRIRLCVTIISAFLFGGAAGAIGFPVLGYKTLFIPAALTGCAAFAYASYRGYIRWKYAR